MMIPRLFPALVVLCCLAASAPAEAEPPAVKPGSGKTKGKGGGTEVKRLDAKLEEVREAFLRDTTNLILSYEGLGQFERARMLLESLQKLDPKNEPVRAKIAELDAKILASSEIEFEIDPEKSWQAVGTVTKDRTVRIRVAGESKLSLTAAVGPEGVPTGNQPEDFVANVPLGAVMGVITPAGAGPTAAGERPPRPFTVGAGYEKPADRDGVLYLRVNLPPGAKCSGRLSAKVGGAERSAP